MIDSKERNESLTHKKEGKYEAIIARDVATIWIANPQNATTYRKEVKGFDPNAENRMPLEKVWLAN